jgi:hypothetical protein
VTVNAASPRLIQIEALGELVQSDFAYFIATIFPDLYLNLRVTIIIKHFEMYPHVESYIISFALIAIFGVSYYQNFNFIEGAHILNVYAFIGNAFCQSVPF